MSVYIGIDPDSQGAMVAIIDGEPIFFDFDSPFTLAMGLQEIKRIAGETSYSAIVEQPNPYRGKQGEGENANSYFATFEQFRLVGVVEGLLIAHGIPYQSKVPRSWKAKVIPQTAKKPRPEQKQIAMDTARQLYPAACDWITLKKHAGRAEALLMAHMARAAAGLFG